MQARVRIMDNNFQNITIKIKDTKNYYETIHFIM